GATPRAGAPCRSPHGGCCRQARRRFGSPTTHPSRVSSAFRRAHRSRSCLKFLASRRGGEVQTESHCGPGQRPVGPTHTCATDLRYDLSAARSVVFDDGKATIWRESGARVRAACFHMFCPRLPNASTLICKLVQCVNVCGGRCAVLGQVDSRACCNTIPCGAARRGGTFRFHGLSARR